jgi:hypothetical protein
VFCLGFGRERVESFFFNFKYLRGQHNAGSRASYTSHYKRSEDLPFGCELRGVCFDVTDVYKNILAGHLTNIDPNYRDAKNEVIFAIQFRLQTVSSMKRCRIYLKNTGLATGTSTSSVPPPSPSEMYL